MMKRIQSYIIAILALGLVIVGCNEQDDFKSSAATSVPTASIAVSAVGDSTFTLTIASNVAGYIGYILAGDTSLTPEAINLLSNNMADAAGVLQSNYFKLSSADDTTIVFTGLTQASYYKVFTAASSEIGVESDVMTYTVKTNDGYAPNLVDAKPLPSGNASVEVGEALTYTFDEPILIDKTKAFTIAYLLEGTSVVVDTADISKSGKILTIKQAYSSYPGDYFTVSWEAGAVTDLSGNAMDSISSSYDFVEEEGSGLYYRTETTTFDVADKSIMPSTDSILVQHDFMVDIKFPYAISLLAEDITSDMITFKYTDWQGLYTSSISGAEGISVVGDSTLRIMQPHMANHGDLIELALKEGVVEDMYNNVNAASDYELAWELGDFNVSDEMITPKNGTLLTSQSFDVKVKFDFPISLVITPDAGKISFTYITTVESVVSKTPLDATVYNIDATNDSVLVISLPAAPEFGSTLVFNMDENVVKDIDGNVNLELVDIVSWEIAELETDINQLLGSYEVVGTSYYGSDYDIIDTVTFALKEGTTDSLVCTSGLFGFDAELYASFDATTSIINFSEQVLGVSASTGNIYTIFGDEDDYSAQGLVLKGGTFDIAGLSLGVYDGTWAWISYGNYLTASHWTKLAVEDKSATLRNATKTIPSVSIFKGKKGNK